MLLNVIYLIIPALFLQAHLVFLKADKYVILNQYFLNTLCKVLFEARIPYGIAPKWRDFWRDRYIRTFWKVGVGDFSRS